MPYALPSSKRKRGFVSLATLTISITLLVASCATGYLVWYLRRQQKPTTVTNPTPTPTHRTFTKADYNGFIKCLETGDAPGIRAFLDAGLPPNARFGYRGPALFEAVEAGRTDLFPLLVSYGADVNGRNHYGQFTLVAWLIQRSVFDEADWDSDEERTYRKQSQQALEWLLRHGADANARRAGDVVPLGLAASRGQVRACQLLLHYGARVNARDEQGRTALHAACAQAGEANPCNPEIIRLLLEHGADPNARTKDGETPLLRLCQCTEDFTDADDVAAARLLLAHGANLYAKDKHGRTILEAARHEGYAQYTPKLMAFLNWYANQHPRQ